MQQSDSTELSIRGPVLVPAGWLIAIVGASGTAVLLAISVTVYLVNQSAQAKTTAEKVSALESFSSDLHRIDNRLTKMETILALTFPEAAKKARLPASE